MTKVRMINMVTGMPRCNAMRTTAYTCDKNEKNQCRCIAKFIFGDEYLCKRHAEVYALQELLDGGEG